MSESGVFVSMLTVADSGPFDGAGRCRIVVIDRGGPMRTARAVQLLGRVTVLETHTL